MQNLHQIFNGKIFRIPDYQRGYAWEDSQREDLWQDLQNLRKNSRQHYMGMIGVEVVPEATYTKWDGYSADSHSKYTFYYIVDGQQRFLTLTILIYTLLNQMKDGEKFGGESKEELTKKYIYRKDTEKNMYIVGYEQDDPSHDFLIAKIFNQTTQNEPIKTAYTKNIGEAKKYFEDKVGLLSAEERKEIYKIISERLLFDFNPFESMEISMIFETMNKRGKPLSHLEMLKNRLIYLISILKIDEDKEKNDEAQQELRKKISDTWKKVYYNLGRDAKSSASDDDRFLRYHWIMYERFDKKEGEFYVNDIFKRVFTVNNVEGDNSKYKDLLEKYRNSIDESINEWFKIYHPKHEYSKVLGLDTEVAFWLDKLNYLGFKGFVPLIMAALVRKESVDEVCDFLKEIEKHVFLLFYVSARRADTGIYHFQTMAKVFFEGKYSLRAIIDDIKYGWTYGYPNTRGGYIDLDSFYKYLKDLFVRDSTQGYFSWNKGLRHLFMEYEQEINPHGNTLSYHEVDIDFIEANTDMLWECLSIKELNDNTVSQYKRQLLYSLGNLVLVKKRKGQIKDLTFQERKFQYYANGTSSERELLRYEEWTPNSIYERGKSLLEFMERRWDISFDSWKISKHKMLFLEFLEPW